MGWGKGMEFSVGIEGGVREENKKRNGIVVQLYIWHFVAFHLGQRVQHLSEERALGL